jgi:hypothetical protein
MGVSGLSKKLVLGRLGLRETGETTSEPDFEVCCFRHPSGWFIVQGPEDFVSRDQLARVSKGGEAVGCYESETVMVSEAYGFRDGLEVWSVLHDPDRRGTPLEVQGDPPAELAGIHDDLMRRQAGESDVDYLFEAPIDLTKAVCGYRWDEVQPEGTEFMMLEPWGAATVRREPRAGLNYEPLPTEVEAELFPVAFAMGFKRATSHKGYLKSAYAHKAPNVLVRRRAESWETLRFVLRWRKGAPILEVFFFIRERGYTHEGREGRAKTPKVRRSIIDRLLGRNRPAPETLETLVEKMKGVLCEVDDFMRYRTESPNIQRPSY